MRHNTHHSIVQAFLGGICLILVFTLPGCGKSDAEVEEEIRSGRNCFLEDELGDVFWDYLNLLQSLENESQIEIERVFERSFQKYSERWIALQSGTSWNEIKLEQKRKLESEYESHRQN